MRKLNDLHSQLVRIWSSSRMREKASDSAWSSPARAAWLESFQSMAAQPSGEMTGSPAGGAQRAKQQSRFGASIQGGRLPAVEYLDHGVHVVDLDLAADVGAAEPELARFGDGPDALRVAATARRSVSSEASTSQSTA